VKRFASLYDALDRTTSTNAKVAAMVAYFRDAPPEDAAWAVHFLAGGKLQRLVPRAHLRQWTLDATKLPAWLVDECHAEVGDAAEAITLLLDAPDRASDESDESDDGGGGEDAAHDAREGAARTDVPLHAWIEERMALFASMGEMAQGMLIRRYWGELSPREIFLLNKLVTGELRVGVSRTLVVRALAEVASVSPEVIEHRMTGGFVPSAERFRELLAPEDASPCAFADAHARPYPFFLASPLEAPLEALDTTLGVPGEWLAEWKWDGIRAALVRRAGDVFLWSRGEELVTARFPEIRDAALRALPDGCVLDGEILAWVDERPLPFASLQRRIGRDDVHDAVRAEAPAVFVAYDVVERGGEDIRDQPLAERRAELERLLDPARDETTLRLSPRVVASSWRELFALRAESRARGVEGLMLKRLASPYRVGRKRGDWWKWKIDPFTIDAVLVLAQPGSGRRASLLTDYTFAVWDGDDLVPVAKAYSGLDDAEILEIDAWLRAHTRERYGPVRAVDAVHVFELGFEGIARSKRHRSGVALRFPRMLRWRKDKAAREADTLDALRRLLSTEA
jgi:DNA ligase-1